MKLPTIGDKIQTVNLSEPARILYGLSEETIYTVASVTCVTRLDEYEFKLTVVNDLGEEIFLFQGEFELV